MKTIHKICFPGSSAMLAGFFLVPVLAMAAEPPPPAGRLLASQCLQCHSHGGFESLAGESAGEIIGELLEMKAKRKPGDIMERHAKAYTEAQIRELAAYLATVRPAGGDEGNHDGDDDHEDEDDD